jgi:copper homeostasis protein
MERQIALEIIATNATDARAAEEGGADRIELVCAMGEGGLTPSVGVVERVCACMSIPVYAMIRPHSRSFRYDADDALAMSRDIRAAREAGAAGVVLGALTKSGEVDVETTSALADEALRLGLGITFHRAIDESADVFRAAEGVARIPGVVRILTSGGMRTAPEAADALKRLNSFAEARGVGVMAGSGMTPDNLGAFVRATGITEIHVGSAVRPEGSFRHAVDPALVAQAKRELRNAAATLR